MAAEPPPRALSAGARRSWRCRSDRRPVRRASTGGAGIHRAGSALVMSRCCEQRRVAVRNPRAFAHLSSAVPALTVPVIRGLPRAPRCPRPSGSWRRLCRAAARCRGRPTAVAARGATGVCAGAARRRRTAALRRLRSPRYRGGDPVPGAQLVGRGEFRCERCCLQAHGDVAPLHRPDRCQSVDRLRDHESTADPAGIPMTQPATRSKWR